MDGDDFEDGFLLTEKFGQLMEINDEFNSNVDANSEVKVDVKIRYPTRKPFMRYMEKLVAPKSTNDKPMLRKRPAPAYLVESWPTSNAFTMIKKERIKELRRQANDRRQAELARCLQPGCVAQKVPRELRQRFTAHNNLKELIYEENIKEIHQHGRLFGPAELTLQPRNKHNVPLLEQGKTDLDATKEARDQGAEKTGLSSGDSGTSKHSDSYSVESSQKDSYFEEPSPHEDKQVRPSFSSSIAAGAAGVIASSSSAGGPRSVEAPRENFDQTNAFLSDRRQICLVNLAIRTKEGEIARLNKMLKDEAAFLAKEEKELLIRHDEHDKYLKSICLRTAEAIKKADTETHKRTQITDKIKRTRYKLAHMNAECIKLEEEFIRLSTYKDFLDSVAKTIEESRAADQRVHKLYTKIFGTDGGTRLDTLMMLKILESTIDDLSKSLAKYSRLQVLKAKKTVDEQNRFIARQRQKELEALAHDAKLKRAIESSKEPPRWHRGRRVITRSNPPEVDFQMGAVTQVETLVVEDSDADLFKY
uniref:DUF4200 domain-containing protein n=1 Tax=Mesocestoides corti TaxID=53468 RepID=A0A5K3FRB2_MESCO